MYIYVRLPLKMPTYIRKKWNWHIIERHLKLYIMINVRKLLSTLYVNNMDEIIVSSSRNFSNYLPLM